MHKARIAEWILSLFTTRERAGATVGDLMEAAPDRGVRYFWSGVLRTAFSLFWSSFAAEPTFMLSIGFRGLILNLALSLILFLCIVVLAALCGVIFVGYPGALPYAWAFGPAGWIAAFMVQVQTGRWIARRAREREMAACAAFLIVQAIVMPVAGEILFGGLWMAELTKGVASAPGANTTGGYVIASTLMPVVALFAGAIWVRLAGRESVV